MDQARALIEAVASGKIREVSSKFLMVLKDRASKYKGRIKRTNHREVELDFPSPDYATMFIKQMDYEADQDGHKVIVIAPR